MSYLVSLTPAAETVSWKDGAVPATTELEAHTIAVNASVGHNKPVYILDDNEDQASVAVYVSGINCGADAQF